MCHALSGLVLVFSISHVSFVIEKLVEPAISVMLGMQHSLLLVCRCGRGWRKVIESSVGNATQPLFQQRLSLVPAGFLPTLCPEIQAGAHWTVWQALGQGSFFV